MNKIVLLLIIIAFVACENEVVVNTQSQEKTEQIVEVITDNTSENIELTANLDNLRIRDVAGLNGKGIATVSKGAKLNYLNEMSDFTDEITLRGVTYNDPWLKIQTEEGQVGWVYAGAIKFDMTKINEDFKTQMVTKRLEKVFGNKLVFEIEQYQKDFAAVKTDKDFILMYRNAKTLQDKLNEKLEAAYNMYEVTDFPDLFWIDDAIPGLNAELVAEGTIYSLLFNYKQLGKATLNTTSDLDDSFINLLIAKNSGEFEDFFAVWYLQTWDYGGYSLLGQGKHVAMLNRMQTLKDKTPLFDLEIKEMKNKLLKDITEGKEYGEQKEKMIEEVNNIINKQYELINSDEIIALKTRIKMFETPEKHKIQVFMKDF
jgi:hypothetical protein